MENLFYSISGLPIHALVVHFAVVLLPISALALIAAIYLPKFKSKYALASVVGIFLGAGSAFIAKQSGEALAARIGNPEKHSQLGNILPLIAFALFVFSYIWFRSRKGRTSRVVTPLSHFTAVLSLGVIALTFLVGHTGAQAVWTGRLPQADVSASPEASSSPQASTSAVAKGVIAFADVKKHNKSKSCWSAINGNVYDLTKWISRHPGGSSAIKGLCGKNGTSQYSSMHGSQRRPANELAAFKIGKLK